MTRTAVLKDCAQGKSQLANAGILLRLFCLALSCLLGCDQEQKLAEAPIEVLKKAPQPDAGKGEKPECNAPPELTTLEKIMDTKILKVGYVNFEPIVFKDPDTGDLRGHFVLAIEEIARQMKVKCEYHETTWANLYKALREGEFHISIAPTFGTISQALSVAVSRPLMYIGSSAIAKRRDRRFRSIQDVDQEGVVVAVTEGESGHRYAQAEIKRAEVVVQPLRDQAITFSQVLEGNADVALGGAHMTAQFAAAHRKEVKDLFADEPYNITGVSWAVKPSDQAFLNFINTALNVLESTGKLAQFEKRYDLHWLHPERLWITY